MTRATPRAIARRRLHETALTRLHPAAPSPRPVAPPETASAALIGAYAERLATWAIDERKARNAAKRVRRARR